MKKARAINNMYLRVKGSEWEVLAPSIRVSNRPSGYRRIADFTKKEEAILFMKTNLSYVSQSTRDKKSPRWISIGTL